MDDVAAQPSRRLLGIAIGLLAASAACVPVGFLVWSECSNDSLAPLYAVATVQFLCGFGALFFGAAHAVKRGKGERAGGIATAVLGALVGLGGPVGAALAWLVEGLGAMGGAWGRPLRLRGRILHPSLRAGSDWTRGARPEVSRLDAPTRAALEALWLHDAQKEHASVPAFARISWLLAAVGAPADLVEWSHRAALEEVDHARRCFALAAGYGGRSHSVEAMPDLLVGGLDVRGDALVHLAVESLKDGCLLEDFNADVAAACARACKDAATGDVLARIAREERSHADFSWALLAWLLERGGAKVASAVEREAAALDRVPRPTAVSAEKKALVARADAARMRDHGRIEDAEWAAMWTTRIDATRARARELVAGPPATRHAA